jgi:non-specific serine/threonine protein kinase
MIQLVVDASKKKANEHIPLSLSLSPSGHLYLDTTQENAEMLSKSLAEKLQSFFSINEAVGLLRLGLTHFDEVLPPSFSFWRQFAQIFITEMCKHAHSEDQLVLPEIAFLAEEINNLMDQAPFIRGIDYFNDEIARRFWANLHKALFEELNLFKGSLSDYLVVFDSSWNTLGRVCFHLAENKNNARYPFAFLATYTMGLSKKNAHPQHLPLAKALEAYAGKNQKSLLLSLLRPVHRATETSVFLKNIVDSGKIFQPLAWSVQEAHQFLKDIPNFESAGVMVRVPNWWNSQKPPRPMISIKLGEKEQSQLGMNALLDFEVHFSLPTGEALSSKEFDQILNQSAQLVQIRGQWVQVDQSKLQEVLLHWKNIQSKVKKQGLTFTQGLRLLSGVANFEQKEELVEEISTWSTVVEGDWLKATLTRLRHPEASNEEDSQKILKKLLKAQLRPYQVQGLKWLWWLYNIGLGGCLADDMGLGKTIQIIALLLLVKQQNTKKLPHLLILPASLIGNWQAEISRFAPGLSFWIAHNGTNREDTPPNLTEVDLIVTTYGMLSRVPWLTETSWDMVILDEAQAIKNPSAKQTRAIKLLTSRIRFVLTGTPIENRLLDLWSLFDFFAPGLLGSSRVFGEYAKKLKKDNNSQGLGQFYAAVRRLVNPYILRRLKSDKRIISDLPDKTEMKTYCTLSKQQIGLYQQAVNELSTKLEIQTDEINRRGLVMSYILRFKQICNHPSQWLGHGQYTEGLSGKFLRLKELCEVIAEKQEKVLIFTQFREVIPALIELLTQVFKQDGLFLHGQTTIKERTKRVAQFQEDQGPPFFVLSLKAGGVGLNLTAASHVIHFDRWWNPAVENQATDRAFRIGQKKNVLVHKFICLGTIEEKIDTLLDLKKDLSHELMGQDNEVKLTELSDVDLLNMVTLDIHRAIGES